jgi:putative ABC transport system ATP-binding protein
LELEKGQIGVILGPSGSGKSTLMNIIGGVDRADSGAVTVDGERITDLNDDQLVEYRRLNVGFIFQSYNLIPNLTTAENIEVVSKIQNSCSAMNPPERWILRIREACCRCCCTVLPSTIRWIL